MKHPLSREHRKILETTVAQARTAAEAGAEKTLKALAVAAAKDAPAHATDAQKKLRVCLRAHGRAMGDSLRPDDTQAIDHLVTEIEHVDIDVCQQLEAELQATRSKGWRFFPSASNGYNLRSTSIRGSPAWPSRMSNAAGFAPRRP